MREIKYRGWVADNAMGNGSWDYATPDDSHWAQFWFCTSKKTIGQYTGLKDKNGKEIYEGDIISLIAPLADFKPSWQSRNGNYEVAWKDYQTCFGVKRGIEWECPLDWWSSMEVIGNIYENPDLCDAK